MFEGSVVPIQHGIILRGRFANFTRLKDAYAAVRRSVSISLSQEMIWFQLGMLWDAKTLGRFEPFPNVQKRQGTPESLQLFVLLLRFDQHRQIGISIFPKRK